MPIRLSPKESKEDSGTVAGSNQPPKCDWEKYFRFHPVAFVEFLIAEINGYKADKQKRDCYTHSLRLFSGGCVRATPFLVAVALVVGVGGYLLYEIGFFESNRVIAFFTFVLTIWAAIQWGTSHRQWQTMHEQNRIMLDQMKQTDAVIENMRLEQRAWLSIRDVKIKPLGSRKQVICSLVIKNSGKTPGRIIAGAIASFVRDPDCDAVALVSEFESLGFPDAQAWIVPPSDETSIETNDLGQLDSETIEAIRLGHKELHILARYAWVDFSGKPHAMTAWHTLIGLGPEMALRGNYCNFD